MEPSTPNGQEFNEAARYAMMLNNAGQSLNLGPGIQRTDQGFRLAKEETDEDVISYYENDPSQGIDLDRPDAEEHWNAIVRGYNKRTTDYAQLIADAGGEIAKIPGDLVEGIAEDGLVKGVASTAEGVVRSIRDLWGMATESENPTSAVFWLNSTLGAFMRGKASKNWREEAQQWNQARKFMYHSTKMQMGDESVLEQYIDMDEATAAKIRSFINPKVAHAMSFIGMELPSILAAPFTGGASAELAMTAAAGKAATATRIGANAAARANLYNKIGTTLANATSKLDNFAQKVTQRAAGSVLGGIGKALEVPANILGGAVGGTVDNLSARTGFSSGYMRNAAESVATDAATALGGVTGGTRQTVGFLGSLGLRTTSELLQEIGNKAMMRSYGVIDTASPTSLTVLESVAANPLLSPSAKVAAKMVNTVVDPVIQLSTSALKHGYKDALTFSFLGYLSDKERGAVGGAAQGMMWGGYSGALRYSWSLVNGGLTHDVHIKNFDESFLPQYIEKTNSKYATFVREVTADSDATKSTRLMSQTRSVAQILWNSLDTGDRKNLIAHIGTEESLKALLFSEGFTQLDKFEGMSKAGGAFQLEKHPNKGFVPILFLNRDKYRLADFGHETLGHALSYALRSKGKLGEHLQRFFGSKPGGGIIGDEAIINRAAIRRSLELATHHVELTNGSLPLEQKAKLINDLAKQNMEAGANIPGSRAYFAEALKVIRDEANSNGGAAYWLHTSANAAGEPLPAAYQGRRGADAKFIFEEGVAGYAESLYYHTNLQDMVLPDDIKPFRVTIERIYNEQMARKMTDLELAGIRANKSELIGPDGRISIQAEAYDDGVWKRSPEYDGLIRSMVKSALSNDAQAINRLSPAQQLAEAKLHGKEFLFNIGKGGATMKGTKELNDMSTKNATDAFEVFKGLDESIRPDIIVDEHGNQSVDMMRIKDQALDAMQMAGAIDPESARIVKSIRDAYTRWESSGFATSNIFTGTYWGDSQRTIKNGFYERLFGNDVAVTHRVFVPFEMKLNLKTTDANGKQLRVPRGGMLMTVVDYMAIHRRKMKMWSRPDVRSTFVHINTFHDAFDEYLVNMMKDAGSRIPTAELFNKKYPGQGDKIRDMMYETFGGSIRKDESYINAPREGYSSSHENPNYPIHSMKLELLVGVELTPGKPMPYHHGRSYEGLRRNYSLAGFERVGMSDGRFVNGQGYEIIKTGAKWKVFSPFGGIVGMFTDFAKAAAGVQKDLARMDLADLMPAPTEIEWADMNRSKRLQYMSEVSRVTQQTYQQRMLDRGNGVSLSLASFDPTSSVRWVPAWKHTYQRMKELLLGGFKTVNDFLEDSSVAGLKEWNSSNGVEKFNPGQITIETPKLKGSEDTKYGPLGKHTGRYFTVQRSGYTGNIGLFIDTNYIERVAKTEEGRLKMLKHAMESTIETQSAAFSPYGSNLAYHFETLNIVKDVDSIDGYKRQAEALMSKHRDPEKYRQKRSEEIGKGRTLVRSDKEYMKNVLVDSPEGMRLLKEVTKGSELKASLDNKKKYAVESNARGVFQNLSERIRPMNRELFDKSFGTIREGLLAVNNIVDGMLNGDESNWIDVASDRGGREYAYSFPNIEDARKIDGALVALNAIKESVADKQVVSQFVSNYIKGPLHALVQQVSPELRGSDTVSVFKTINDSRVISAEYTFNQLNSAIKEPVAIVFYNGNITLVGNGGIGATFRGAKQGWNAMDASILGGTEIARNAQADGFKMSDSNAYAALVRHEMLPDSKRLSQRDVQAMTHVGMLEAAIIAMNPELDAKLKELRSAYESTEGSPADRVNYSELLLTEVIENANPALIGLATAVHSIEKALDPSERIRAVSEATTTDLSQYQKQLSDRFMAEALANWELEMQKYWSLGSPLSKMSEALDTVMGRKFYAEHGLSPQQRKRADTLIETIRKFHKEQEAFFERSKSEPSMSLADVTGLSSVQKDELTKLGLIKKVMVKGRMTEIFEISDRDSYVDYTTSGGAPHLLPFADSPDMQKAFDAYAAEVKARMTTPGMDVFMDRNKILGQTKLGKVFGHDLLYRYFPQLKDVDVRFVDIHGARAIRTMNDTFIIEIGARALASAELNLPVEFDKFKADAETLASKFSGSNYITGLFVHEVQHILQKMGNLLDEETAIQGVANEAIKENFAKLLGVDYTDNAPASYFEAKYGIRQQRMVDALVAANNPPVITSLEYSAKPIVRSAVRNMMEFVTAEHTAGRLSDELYRAAGDLHYKAGRLDTIADAYSLYKELDAFKEKVGDASPRYVTSLAENKEFRAAIAAMGMVTHYANMVNTTTPGGRIIELHKAITNYSRLEYVMDPVERQAFTTQQRRGLSQLELAMKDRIAAENTSVLQIIDDAMNKGIMRGRSLSQSTVLMSIAGIGEKADDNRGAQMFGKMALVRYLAARASDELDNLGRFIVQKSGWEIDENGRLVLTSGHYLVKGDYYAATQASKQLGKENLSYEGGSFMATAKETGKTGQPKTYTINDFAKLAGFVIEAEDILSVGNSVIDIVNSDRFPAMVLGGEIRTELSKHGLFSEDAAKAVLLDSIDEAMKDHIFTKNDLLNILAFNHINFSTARSVSGKGGIPSAKGMKLGKEHMLRLTKNDPSYLEGVFNEVSGRNNRPVSQKTSKITLGRYVWDGAKISFSMENRPSWASAEDWAAFKKRVDSGMFIKNLPKVAIGTEYANMLNDRINRATMLIGPLVQQAVKKIESNIENDPKLARRLYGLLLDDMAAATVELVAGAHFPITTLDSGLFENVGSFFGQGDGSSAILKKRLGFNAEIPTAYGEKYGTRYLRNVGFVPSALSGIFGTYIHDIKDAQTIASTDVAETRAYGNNIDAFQAQRLDDVPTSEPKANLMHFDEQKAGSYRQIQQNLPGSSQMLDNIMYSFGKTVEDHRASLEELGTVKRELDVIATANELDENFFEDGSDINNYLETQSGLDGFMSKYTFAELAALPLETRAALVQPLISDVSRRISSIESQVTLAMKVMDVWRAGLSSRDAMFKSAAEQKMSSQFSTELQYIVPSNLTQYRGQTLTGVFGAVTADGKGIVSVDPFSVSFDGLNSYKMTSEGRGIPAEAIEKINRNLNNVESYVGFSLFNLQRPQNLNWKEAVTNPTKFKQDMERSVGGYDRAKVFFEYLDKLTDPVSVSFIGLSNERTALAHYIGGNILTVQSMMGMVMLKNEGGPENNAAHLQASLPQIMSIFSDRAGPLAQASISDNKKVVFNVENGVHLTNSALGAAVSPYIFALLRNGLTRTTESGLVELTNFGAITSDAFAFLETKIGEGNATPYEFRGYVNDWVSGISSEVKDRIAHELTSQHSTAGILTMLGLMSGVAFEVGGKRLPDNFEFTLRDSLNFGSAYGMDHLMSQHAALQEVKNLGPGKVAAMLGEVISAAIHDDRNEFWHGVAAGLAAMKDKRTKGYKANFHESYSSRKHTPVRRLINDIQLTDDSQSFLFPFYSPPVATFRHAPEYTPGIQNRAYEGASFARERSFGPSHGIKYEREAARTNWESFDADRGIDAAIKSYVTPVSYLEHTREPISIYDAIDTSIVNLRGILEDDNVFGDDEGNTGKKVLKQKDVGGSNYYTDTDYVIGTGGITLANSPALGNVLSQSFKRSLMTNRLAAIAKQLGKTELSFPAGRYAASSSPNPSFLQIVSTEGRQNAMKNAGPMMWKTMAAAGTTGMGNMMHGRDYGKIGFSWRRLEDGRIMVNFSPDTNIAASYDTVHDDNWKPSIGIPLLRAVGWDANGKTAVSQSIIRKSILNSFAHNNPIPTNMVGNKYLFSAIGKKYAAIDQASIIDYLQGVRKLMLGDIYLGGSTQNKMSGGTGMTSITGHMLPKIRETLQSLLDGNIPSGKEDLYHMLVCCDEFMHDVSQEWAYQTFILPKDAKIEDFNAAVFSNYGSAGIIDSPWSGARSLRSVWGGNGPTVASNFGQIYQRYAGEGVGYARLVDFMMKQEPTTSSGNAALQLLGKERGSGNGGVGPDTIMMEAIKSANIVNQNMHGDMTAAFHRIMTGDSGYFLPDNERALAMTGDRSGIIEMMFPDRADLQHYAWDSNKSLNLTVFKNAQKRYTIAWNEFGPVGQDGRRQVRRMVRNLDTESEANALADKIAAGGINAEVAKLSSNPDSIRLEEVSATSTATYLVQRSSKLNLVVQADTPVYADGVWGVGNLPKVFKTAEEARKASNIIRKGEVITAEAPKQDRISLSIGDQRVEELENSLRTRLNFALGGSPIHFSSTLINSIIKGMDKHKRVKDVRTGIEWFDLLTSNRVSKGEMRTTGMAHFLYANKDNNLSKKDILEYLNVFYPRQGRKLWQSDIGMMNEQMSQKLIRSPHNENYQVSKMLYAGRTLALMQGQLNAIQHEITKASDENRPAMETALQALRDIHLNSLKEAYEKTYSKDTVVRLVDELGLKDRPSDEIVSGIFNALATDPDRIMEFSAPLLEYYRLGFNESAKKASAESLAALSGIEIHIPDPATISVDELAKYDLTLKDWETNTEGYWNTKVKDQSPYGLYRGPDAGYSGYTSGLGEHVYQALFTESMPVNEEFTNYITALAQNANDGQNPPELRKKYLDSLQAAKHIMAIKKAIANGYARTSTSHRGAPMGNLIGHLRLTDASVASVVPVQNPVSRTYDILKKNSDEAFKQIPVTFVEELQSDTYQRKEFGARPEEELSLYSSFKEIEENPALKKELNEIIDKLSASRMNLNSKRSWMNNTARQYVRRHFTAYINKEMVKREVMNSGPFLRFIISRDDDPSVWTSRGEVSVPESLTKNYGLPSKIPDLYPVGELSSDATRLYRRMVDEPLNQLLDGAINAYFLGAEQKMPGFGGMDHHVFLNGSHSMELRMQGMAKYFLALSPEFIAHTAEVSDLCKVADGAGGIAKFDKVDFDKLASDWAAKVRLLSENQEFTRRLVESGLVTVMDVAAMRKMARVLEDMSSGEAKDIAYQDTKISMTDQHGSQSPLPTDDPMFPDHKTMFECPSETEVRSFVIAFCNRASISVPPQVDTMRLAREAGILENRQYMSLRTMMAKTVNFLMDVSGGDMEQVTGVLAAGNPDLTGKMLEEFVTGRYKGKDNFRVIDWLNSFYTSDYPASSNFRSNFGSLFKNMDYDMDSVSGLYESQGTRYIQHKARTFLGKTMESMAPVVAVLHESFKENSETEKLKARQAEIAKKTGLTLDNDGDLVTNVIPDGMPHGEDNAYRPIMVNFYVMRALQKRQRGLVIADARHHRSRYHSSGYVNLGVNLGGGKAFMLSGYSNTSKIGPEAAYVLDLVRKRGMMNKLIDRVRAENLDFTSEVEIEGTKKSVASWLIDAGNKVIDEFPDAFSSEKTKDNTVRNYAAVIEAVYKKNKELKEGGYTQDKLESTFNSVNDGQDMQKRMSKMVASPEGILVAMPYDKTHGYAVNYGAPTWLNEYYYAGNPRKAIESVSHDAFEKASIAMANDKTYVVLAPNGKVLFEKIATMEEAEERAAQASKYLGNVPHLTMFLKQYSRVGAYVMEAFMQSSFRSGSHQIVTSAKQEGFVRNPAGMKEFTDLRAGSGLQGITKESYNEGRYSEVFAGPASVSEEPFEAFADQSQLAGLRGSKAEAVGPYDIKSEGVSWSAPVPLMLHAMGLDANSSSQEIAAGMSRVVSFNGPMLVIKPNFPTASHASEMAKLIVDGITLMSLADQSNQTKVAAMKDAYNWFRAPKQTRDDESRPAR
jgi:hypothetical protein